MSFHTDSQELASKLFPLCAGKSMKVITSAVTLLILRLLDKSPASDKEKSEYMQNWGNSIEASAKVAFQFVSTRKKENAS